MDDAIADSLRHRPNKATRSDWTGRDLPGRPETPTPAALFQLSNALSSSRPALSSGIQPALGRVKAVRVRHPSCAHPERRATFLV